MSAPSRVLALVNEVRRYCAEHKNPDLAKKWERYFKEGYDAWGLLDPKHPFFNERQQEWFENYRWLGLKGFFQAGEALFESGKYEEGAIAIRFVKELREELDASSLEAFAGWFAHGIGNWAHTDVLCKELIEPLLVSGKVAYTCLAPWRESEHRFQRRAVPVAMLGLLKGAKDVQPFLDFLQPMMLDPERVVHQGLGWFLREAWKKHPAPVEQFLLEWKDQSARLIYQYATEKMTKERRAKFKRG